MIFPQPEQTSTVGRPRIVLADHQNLHRCGLATGVVNR